MAKAKKTWKEKLDTAHGLPKVEKLTGKAKLKYRDAETMAIPCPRDIDEIMKTVPKGKILTSRHIGRLIAQKYDADMG